MDNKNALRDLIGYYKGIDNGNFSQILPTIISLTTEGISGVVIGNLFDISQDLIPDAYKGLSFVVKKVRHNVRENMWETIIEGYPFINRWEKSNNLMETIEGLKIKAFTPSFEDIIIKPVHGVNKENIYNTINFFKNKGYKNNSIAAIVGGLIQESNIEPLTINKLGAYGIAQWLGDRKNKLQLRKEYNSLNTQLEFIHEEIITNIFGVKPLFTEDLSFESAIKLAASYEHFKGYDSDNYVSGEWGSRVAYSKDILQNFL